MRRSKHSSIAIALLCGLLSLSILSEPSLANSRTDNVRQGLPGRRISGGSRSPSTACLLSHSEAEQKVVSLTPENNLNRTVSAHPTFWFSLPAIASSRQIEFALMDQNEELVYAETIQATGKAGLESISLPETAPELQPDEAYRWHLSVVCDPNSRATDLVVWGWIERTLANPSTLQQIEAATPQDRLALYSELSAWNDMLTELVGLYRDRKLSNQSTTDLENQWTSLLASENLSQLADDPSTASQ